MNIQFPTVYHQNYIKYITNFCKINRISLFLCGSVSKNTAKKFSDIDLVMQGNITGNLLDKLILGYDKIIMTNYTENPKGIIILNYHNLISVDLDIRYKVVTSELKESLILCDYGWEIGMRKVRKKITSQMIFPKPNWHKTLRLIHRCLIKYLCKEDKTVTNLINDIIKDIKTECNVILDKDQNILSILTNALLVLETKYKIDNDIIKMLQKLLVYAGMR